VDDALAWYERDRPTLALEFLAELRASFDRIADGPFRYPHLRSGVRRALVKRFPYAVYFTVEDDVILVVAVVHTSRNPAAWQRRIE
jgi:plasmid stabilization system protein ParE